MIHFSFDFNLFNSSYYLYERFLVVLFSLVPSVLLVLFILYTDRKSKEPAKNIILCLLSGILTIALSQYFESLVMPYFSNNVVLTYIWAMIEELSKACIFFLFLFDNKYFDDIYDGIVYMALIAISFAGLENIMYAFSESTVSSSISLALMRDFTTIPLHVICGVIIGFFLSLACFSKDKKSKYINIFLSVFFATVVHGTFNNLMTLLSTFNVSSTNSLQVIFLMVFPLLLIMAILFFIAFKFVNKSLQLNEIFINNGTFMEGYAYLMNSSEYKNSDSGKKRIIRYNKLTGVKDNKESDNKIEANKQEEVNVIDNFEVKIEDFVNDETPVELENTNHLEEVSIDNFDNVQIDNEMDDKKQTEDINLEEKEKEDIISKIDLEIEKELESIGTFKTNKKKTNAISKQKRKYYRGNKNRR